MQEQDPELDLELELRSRQGGSDNEMTGHGALNRHRVAHVGTAGGR